MGKTLLKSFLLGILMALTEFILGKVKIDLSTYRILIYFVVSFMGSMIIFGLKECLECKSNCSIK